MSTQFNTTFYFESGSQAIGPETFGVTRFEGDEAISSPYRFTIDLVSDDPEVDVEEMIANAAVLRLVRDDKERRIHGVLAEFEQLMETKGGQYMYRAVLVPRMWLLSLNRQNQIYQNLTIPQIVAHEFTAKKHIGKGGAARAGLVADDIEFRLTRSYPEKEYMVQYNESDLNFISRLMEHEGLFYYFEQFEDREKLIVSDNNIHFMAIDEADATVPFRPPDGLSTFVEESVHTIGLKQTRIPKKFTIKEYNYRLAHLPLKAEAETEDPAYGLNSTYGEHFSTPEEGEVLARIRAEEAQCGRTRYNGQGDVLAFAPGLQFVLDEHFREDFNQRYTLTGVHHDGSQPASGVDGVAVEGAGGEKTEYRNAYSAIPAAVAFRPQRRTPKPKLYGIMNAHVDASTLEDRAEIDDKGRYKLVMPFDASGAGEGKATRWVRMASPYGGSRHGMHFPLLKGTEVIWTCVDGDPDRPVIIGAVPNPLQPSVVTNENSTRNVLQTVSGVMVEIEDGPASDPNGGTKRASGGGSPSPQPARQAAPSEPAASGGNLPVTAAATLGGPDKALAATSQQQADTAPADPLTGDVSQASDNTHKWYKIKVPDYDGANDSYIRLGRVDAAESVETAVAGMQHNMAGARDDDEETDPDDLNGIFEYTDGNRTEIVKGNKDELIQGRRRVTIGGGDAGVWDAGTAYQQYMRKTGRAFGTDIWRLTTKQHVQADTYEWGDRENFFGGFTFDGMAGLATSAFIGGKLDVDIAPRVNLEAAFDVNIAMQNAIDFTHGEKVSMSKIEQIKADHCIVFRIPDEPTDEALTSGSLLAGAGAFAAIGAIIGAFTTALASAEDEETTSENMIFGTSLGAVTAAYAALLLMAAGEFQDQKNKIREDDPLNYIQDNYKTDSIVYMDDDDIVITTGPGSIRVHEEKAAIKKASKRKGGRITIEVEDAHETSEIVIKAKNVTVESAEKLELSSKQTVDIVSAKAISINSKSSEVNILGKAMKISPRSGTVRLG